MPSDLDYLIVRQEQGDWEITQEGKHIVSTPSVVMAIDVANRLADHATSVHKQQARVILVDERPTTAKSGK